MLTKFQIGNILTCHIMDGQTYTIEKAIRPVFANPVTYHCLPSHIKLINSGRINAIAVLAIYHLDNSDQKNSRGYLECSHVAIILHHRDTSKCTLAYIETCFRKVVVLQKAKPL